MDEVSRDSRFHTTQSASEILSLREIKEAVDSVTNPRHRAVLETALLTHHSVFNEPEKIVVLIHGIRTHAEWQERLKGLLATHNIKAYPIGYGFYDVLRFLCPFLTRRRPQERVARELRSVRVNHPAAEISVVAHSFGTYVVTEVLADATDIRLHRLLLCGSVVPTNYRWDKIRSRVTGAILNDAGVKDIWPALSKMTWGYGPSGTVGFKTADVEDRFHWCGHSGFFEDDHMESYWIPFLKDGQVVPPKGGRRHATPWYISIFCRLPLKIIATLMLIYAFSAYGPLVYKHMIALAASVGSSHRFGGS